jgi:hypothetical protein
MAVQGDSGPPGQADVCQLDGRGRWRSSDGHWFWDGTTWQPVAQIRVPRSLTWWGLLGSLMWWGLVLIAVLMTGSAAPNANSGDTLFVWGVTVALVATPWIPGAVAARRGRRSRPWKVGARLIVAPMLVMWISFLLNVTACHVGGVC